MKYEFSDELKSEIDMLVKLLPPVTEDKATQFMGMIEIITKVAYIDGYQAGLDWMRKNLWPVKE